MWWPRVRDAYGLGRVDDVHHCPEGRPLFPLATVPLRQLRHGHEW